MEDCLFCKIIKGEIPSKKVFENDYVYAFLDIEPQAPFHAVFVPKAHISSANDINDDNAFYIGEIFKAIKQVAKENGFDYGVEISVGEADFNTREYNKFTLPAGKYKAVRVVLGNGKGKNWWCVMFPPLCLPAACPPEDAPSVDSVLTDGEADLVQNGPRYQVRFKAVEWVEAALQALRDWL